MTHMISSQEKSMMSNICWCAAAAMIAGVFASGCTVQQPRVDNSPQAGTTSYVNTRTEDGDIGIGSLDVVSMSDVMMRDMLADPILAPSLEQRSNPPRVIIDSAYFKNEGSSRINLNTLTDRLRVSLARTANGRMYFVGREYAEMVEKERALKREGQVDSGTNPSAKAAAGADYRLGGRITTIDKVNAIKGQSSRFHQITYEMIDLETGQIVWSNIYDFKKAGETDWMY